METLEKDRFEINVHGRPPIVPPPPAPYIAAMRLPDLEAWAIFACVIEHHSFSAAAEAVGVSKATVSKAIARLEAQIGAALFHRTSRRLTLTEQGRSLADPARAMLAQARAAEEAAQEGAAALAGRVRVSAPMSFGLAHVAPVIARFLAEQPGIEIDLNLSDAVVDIVAEGFDVALRIGTLPDSSLRARRLRPVAMHIVGAPGYFARRGRPAHAAALAEHRLLGYSNAAGPWQFTGPGGAQVALRASGPLTANSGEALLPALCAGLGMAVLPDFIVAAELASGRLEAVLPEWQAAPLALHLLTPPATLRPARVEALLAFLTEALGAADVSRTVQKMPRLVDSPSLELN